MTKKIIYCTNCNKEIKGHEVCISLEDFNFRCPICAKKFDKKKKFLIKKNKGRSVIT